MFPSTGAVAAPSPAMPDTPQCAMQAAVAALGPRAPAILAALRANGVNTPFELASCDQEAIDRIVVSVYGAGSDTACAIEGLRGARLLLSKQLWNTALPPVPEEALAPPKAIPSNTVHGLWSKSRPDRRAGRLWVEELCSGRNDWSAHHCTAIMREVFQEKLVIATEKSRVVVDSVDICYSFEHRCRASSFRMVDLVLLDQSDLPRGRLPNQAHCWEGGPTKRIRLDMAQILAAPPAGLQGAVRPRSALADECRVRNHCHSIAKSWESYQSGIQCYGLFMDCYHPRSAHFLVEARVLEQYATAFRNSGTYASYVNSLIWACRLIQSEVIPQQQTRKHGAQTAPAHETDRNAPAH